MFICVSPVGKIMHLPGIAGIDPEIQIVNPSGRDCRTNATERKTESTRFCLQTLRQSRVRL